MNKNIFSFKAPSRLFSQIGTIALMIVLVGVPAISHAEILNRQLEVGMTGSDISSLQTFLAADVSLYPQGLVTGYFGFRTKSAVSNFQSRNNIPAVGRVGPMTLPVLNSQMAGGGLENGGDGGPAALITGVNVFANTNNATVTWNTNEFAQGKMYYSANPLLLTEHPNSVDVSGLVAMTDTSLRTSQSVTLQNLQSNTTYYFLIYVTDQGGNVSVTWPATFHTAN